MHLSAGSVHHENDETHHGRRVNRTGRGGRPARAGDGRESLEDDPTDRAKRYNRRERRGGELQGGDGSDDSREGRRSGRNSKDDGRDVFSENLPKDGNLTDGLGESDDELGEEEEEPLKAVSVDKKKRGKKARIGEDRRSLL